MTGAEVLVRALEKENVTEIFGYPGAANAPIYEELSRAKINHILTRHEQGAAHAASGYARVTGKAGVCMATSGPGATNLITGIATAYMDSIPMVAITGQVSSELIGRDVFQEVDITGATEPFCKHSYLVNSPNEISRIVAEAFYIATTGRPGPVLIDLPIDIQKEKAVYKEFENIDIRGYKPTYKGHSFQLKKVINAINNAKKPIVCAGGGVVSSNAGKDLLKIAEKVGIPITTTLMGVGSIPGNHPLCLGMIGSHGVNSANRAVANSDLLIVAGARAGDRATGNASKFARQAQIVHIDIDPAEIGKNLGTDIPVVGDIKTVLEQLKQLIKSDYKQEWVNTVSEWKNKDKTKEFTVKEGYVNPKYVLNVLSEITGGDAFITTEVGQNQIWTANNYITVNPGTFLTSGGLGTMGYGLPSAIGAKVGRPDETVVAIMGDGSFQMSMQELGTMKQWGINIKMILFNNGSLGMVRELQRVHYSSNYFAIDLSGSPDFIKLVSAYDIPGEKVDNNDNVKQAIKKALEYDGSYLLEFIVDPEEKTL